MVYGSALPMVSFRVRMQSPSTTSSRNSEAVHGQPHVAPSSHSTNIPEAFPFENSYRILSAPTPKWHYVFLASNFASHLVSIVKHRFTMPPPTFPPNTTHKAYTLIFPVNREEKVVYLGIKNRGFGKGKRECYKAGLASTWMAKRS